MKGEERRGRGNRGERIRMVQGKGGQCEAEQDSTGQGEGQEQGGPLG